MRRRNDGQGAAGHARDEGMALYQRSGREGSPQYSFISEISPEEEEPTGFWHTQCLPLKFEQLDFPLVSPSPFPVDFSDELYLTAIEYARTPSVLLLPVRSPR